MLGSFYKPGRLSRKPPFNPRVRLVRANDGRGTFTFKILRGGEPVVGGRRGGGANFYGGARYDYRGGGVALYRWRPVDTAILIDMKEHHFSTCSSNLFRTNFKAATSAAFLFARSASLQLRDVRRDPSRLVAVNSSRRRADLNAD
jgi:hypothetical protein